MFKKLLVTFSTLAISFIIPVYANETTIEAPLTATNSAPQLHHKVKHTTRHVNLSHINLPRKKLHDALQAHRKELLELKRNEWLKKKA